MPWEAFHLDLHFEVMSVGRVRPALLGRPDREEAAQTLGPESFGRVEGQWALRMAEYRGANYAHKERFQSHLLTQVGSLPIFQMRLVRSSN